MKENLLKIINHYGVNHQQRKFQEEVFELQEAILTKEIDYQSSDTTVSMDKANLEHITEEIADVMVMLEQFRLYYDIPTEEIRKVMEYKVKRQIDRINQENKE